MSYLLDRKSKRKKFFLVALTAFFLIFAFYFRAGIFRGLSSVTHTFLRPILVLGNSAVAKLGSLGSYFTSKSSLLRENEDLKLNLSLGQTRVANYDSLLAENVSLKEILGRKDEKINMTLGVILGKPPESAYDTLIIDVGEKEGISLGDTVFALGSVPIGRIAEVYSRTSKVVLFSTSGEKTSAVVPPDVFMEVVGRGGGNFEIILPRDFVLEKGQEITWPGIDPYPFAIVETIISDPRDPFIKALLISPVNIGELKFVQVEHQK